MNLWISNVQSPPPHKRSKSLSWERNLVPIPRNLILEECIHSKFEPGNSYVDIKIKLGHHSTFFYKLLDFWKKKTKKKTKYTLYK